LSGSGLLVRSPQESEDLPAPGRDHTRWLSPAALPGLRNPPVDAGRLAYGSTNSSRDPGRLDFSLADRITSRIWVTRRYLFASVKIAGDGGGRVTSN
jgi:hypothetical protein